MKKLMVGFVGMTFALGALALDKAEKPEKPAAGGGGERVVVYKLVDMAGTTTYDSCSPTEWTKKKAEIDEEARFFPRAVALAEKEWKENKENKTSFPKGAISEPKILEMGRFSSAEADKKLSSYRERGMPREDEKKKPAEKDKEKAAKDAAREAEKRLNVESAIMTIQTHMKELAGGGGQKKDEPAKKDGAAK